MSEQRRVNWPWAETWIGQRYRWLRVIGTVVFCFGALILGGVVLQLIDGGRTVMLAQRTELSIEVMRAQLIVLGLVFCVIPIAVATGVRILHWQPARLAFTDGRPFDWRFCLRSALVWSVLLIGMFVALRELPTSYPPELAALTAVQWALIGGGAFVAFAVQSSAEEIFFRGYLLPQVAAWTRRRWLALLIVTVLFAAAHYGSVDMYGMGFVALIGVLTGLSAMRAGTLAPAIGLHVANNWIQFLRDPTILGGIAAQHEPIDPFVVPPADAATPYELAIGVAPMVLWTLWLLWATRRRGGSGTLNGAPAARVAALLEPARAPG